MNAEGHLAPPIIMISSVGVRSSDVVMGAFNYLSGPESICFGGCIWSRSGKWSWVGMPLKNQFRLPFAPKTIFPTSFEGDLIFMLLTLFCKLKVTWNFIVLSK